jgi:di/tricarboxylate transporter
MSVQVVSVVVLLVVFLTGTLRPINLGALALVATFGVGLLLAGEDYDTAISGFPVDVFVLLFGVTYLFAIASVNGTVEWLVNAGARLVRENRAAMPLALFVLAAIPTTAGAAGPADVALLAPIALRMGQRYDLDPRLVALMVINGSNSGNFSPLNVLGVIVNGTIERNGLHVNPGWVWLGNFAFTVLLAAVAFLLFGGAGLVREARTARTARATAMAGSRAAGGEGPGPMRLPDAPGGGKAGRDATAGAAGRDAVRDGAPAERHVTAARVATLVAIVAVAAGALVFGLDIGMLAVTAAVLLHLVFPITSKGALPRVSWSTVLLICGVVTYVGLLQRIGTVTMIGNSVARIGTPVLAALLLCLIAGLVSAFASSIGVLGAMIPLALPFLLGGHVAVTGVVIALAVSATAVDATPFSSMGALTVASAPESERDSVYKGLMRWGFAMVVVAPVTTWLAFVVL